MAEIVEIPVEKIKVGEHAQRMEIENEDLDELAASIRRIGIIVPLLVRPEGDLFVVIAGHRRFAAAGRVGLEKIPCCVREDSAAAGTEVSIAENLFRTDLTPIEMAAAIKDILDQGVMDPGELARAMHRSKDWINRMVSILAWPADTLKCVHEGWLSVAAASNLALITDEDYRVFLENNARNSGATARTTSAWLQAFRSMAPPQEAVTREPGPAAAASIPAVPQAPCFVCSEVHRTDALSSVLICTNCINAVRGVGVQG
ncbi:Chromosome-partitioning protein Spo0J [subsurface metagenome]